MKPGKELRRRPGKRIQEGKTSARGKSDQCCSCEKTGSLTGALQGTSLAMGRRILRLLREDLTSVTNPPLVEEPGSLTSKGEAQREGPEGNWEKAAITLRPSRKGAKEKRIRA